MPSFLYNSFSFPQKIVNLKRYHKPYKPRQAEYHNLKCSVLEDGTGIIIRRTPSVFSSFLSFLKKVAKKLHLNLHIR